MYIPHEVIEERKNIRAFEKEKSKKIDEMHNQIAELADKIAELIKVADDENQTVKTVKEARNEISLLKDKLSKLKHELNLIENTDWDDGYWHQVVLL